jgi:hypothetical protein
MTHTTHEPSDADLRKGATIAALSAISYSTAIIFVRYAYQAGILPGTAIFLRFAIAAIVLMIPVAGPALGQAAPHTGCSPVPARHPHSDRRGTGAPSPEKVILRLTPHLIQVK